MSCRRPLANGGEGMSLPTVSLSLRGASQGAGGAALRWRRRGAYPLATANVSRLLMRRLQGRKRNNKVALKPQLRRLTGAHLDMEFVASFATFHRF